MRSKKGYLIFYSGWQEKVKTLLALFPEIVLLLLSFFSHNITLNLCRRQACMSCSVSPTYHFLLGLFTALFLPFSPCHLLIFLLPKGTQDLSTFWPTFDSINMEVHKDYLGFQVQQLYKTVYIITVLCVCLNLYILEIIFCCFMYASFSQSYSLFPQSKPTKWVPNTICYVA